MRSKPLAAFAMLAPVALGLAGCVAPVGPVEVTRFNREAALPALGHGTISIEAAPGTDPNSLEIATYQTAVGRELSRIGYQTVSGPTGAQIAQVRVERTAYRPERNGGPVSVGGGASVGSWGSGVGLGVGIDLSGKPPEQVATRLSVTIRDRASGETLWEGRASFTVAATAPLAQNQLGAAKMAAALFAGFPGNSGETISVP